jgi:hypothetical protein
MRHTRSAARKALGILVVLAFALNISGCGSSPAKLPYSDPAAVGFIGLCDRSGHPVHGGSTSDGPFAWLAVSSVAAPAPYNGAGRTATLLAFQPRQGVDPGQWSGALLTASSRYTNPKHPMAQLTSGDLPLSDYLSTYPVRWDGLIQLRLYLGSPAKATLTRQYAATDIRIKGKRWTVVRGGDVDCKSGSALSLESLLTPSPGPS